MRKKMPTIVEKVIIFKLLNRNGAYFNMVQFIIDSWHFIEKIKKSGKNGRNKRSKFYRI
jgi:hypothetical protein